MSSFCEESHGWPDGVCTGSVSVCQSEQLKPTIVSTPWVWEILWVLCLLLFAFSVSGSVEVSSLGKV